MSSLEVGIVVRVLLHRSVVRGRYSCHRYPELDVYIEALLEVGIVVRVVLRRNRCLHRNVCKYVLHKNVNDLNFLVCMKM